MFGYLQIQKSELKVKEYEAYKAVYCGLCKQLGKDYSVLARLILSYDCTFYTLALLSLHRSCHGFSDGRCRFNPLKKCRYADCKDDAYSKASALSVIAAYYKLTDNLQDEAFWKKLPLLCIKPLFAHWQRKAARHYPEIEAIVHQMMDMQQELEAKQETSVDACAHPTGYMLAEIFSLEATDDMQRRVFYEAGYQLGRWVYLMDAADDWEKDEKHHSFNPFHSVDPENRFAYVNGILNQSLARAYSAYQLINITDFKGILDNMMLYGFPSKQNSVLSKWQEETHE